MAEPERDDLRSTVLKRNGPGRSGPGPRCIAKDVPKPGRGAHWRGHGTRPPKLGNQVRHSCPEAHCPGVGDLGTCARVELGMVQADRDRGSHVSTTAVGVATLPK
jgi:hypothetical protein